MSLIPRDSLSRGVREVPTTSSVILDPLEDIEVLEDVDRLDRLDLDDLLDRSDDTDPAELLL
jgi:hypothetical protein